MKLKKTKLQKWLELYHLEGKSVSKRFNVNSNTARHWRLGYGLPKPELMLRIKKLSGLSCDQMIAEYFKNPQNHAKYAKRSSK